MAYDLSKISISNLLGPAFNAAVALTRLDERIARSPVGVTGIINERYVVGMTWEQVLQARLIGTAIMIPSGRPYGMWRDLMMRRARANAFSHWSWDSIALLSFQTPIYASIIFLSGATGLALILGTATAALMMICLGRPYGMFLLLIRRAFRVETTVGAVASS